jgi:4-aminobutyrate aminotransferase-like enzyme/Ser/Thr protein kinase RdoA (MazF antagonist)
LLALKTSPAVLSVAEAERITRDLYGLAVSARALSGERDANFHVRTADQRDYVLKIIDARSSAETTDCQIRVLRHLAEQDPGLPVPRLFPTLAAEDCGRIDLNGSIYATTLTSFLPGRLLAEIGAPGAPLLGAVGAALGRLDRALQGFFHPTLAQHLAWDVRRLPELVEFAPHIGSERVRRQVEHVAAAIKDKLPGLRGHRSQAIHGDGHGSNILVDRESMAVTGILDFGDMIHAPLILEPAVAMAELVMADVVDFDASGAVLRGYAESQVLEPRDIEVLADLVAARQAVMILVHAWRSHHHDHGVRAIDRPARRAVESLDWLLAHRDALIGRWTTDASSAARIPVKVWSAENAAHGSVDLERRHRLMGKGAELFYERPLHFVRGSGVFLYDRDGNAYLDVYNNVAHVGHAHPAVVSAIQTQIATLATHTRYLHAGILDYAEQLTATLPSHLNTCMFVNSGSEANDVAWRLAQFATGHGGGVVMQHAYHGITDAVSALTPSTGEPRDPKVVTLAAPPDGIDAQGELSASELNAVEQDADQAIARLASRGLAPAAFFIDSSMTSTGVFDPPPAWAVAVAARIRAAGGLIVADEVQYGLGRSGSHFWSFARRGLTPDIVTLGKPVGNGFPMGVVVANRALVEAFQAKYGFFSTFGGNAVAAAAGLAVLDVLYRGELQAHAYGVSAYLRTQLAQLATRHPCLGRVRGFGLLLGLEVIGSATHTPRQRAKRIINLLASQSRVLIGYEGPHASILKIRPPMPFSREHGDRLVEAIDAAATAVDRG